VAQIGAIVRHFNPNQAGVAPAFIPSPGSPGDYIDEDETLTRLIARIYDAALAPTVWPTALAEIAAFVGGQAAGILSKNSISKDSTTHHHFGVDPRQVQIYSATHSRLDPFSSLPFFDVEQIVTIPELLPYDEFCRGRFFREWMEPQGWVDAANCVLEKGPLSCSFLTVIRSKAQGTVDEEMRRRMALVVPHVRRAVLVGRAINLEQVRAEAFARVLDGLSAGLLLIGADGTVMHANSAGHEMLRSEGCLRSISGRLVICDREMNTAWQGALTPAVQAGVSIDHLAFPLIARNGDRYLVHVLPLRSSAGRDPLIAQATAAVFVRKAVMDDVVPEVIARAFDLTPAELRVLLAVIEVGGIPQAASVLGVADSTVKTHVGRLFEKTGTSRQADLVKLAAGYCTPLLN
jgi:DNA-binding CsgD family transcriptional regulator